MKNLLAVILSVCFFCASVTVQAAESTYYVVRHAEKMDGDNPMLTAKGVSRAAHVANMLADAHIKAIYSTQTNRTIMTATGTTVAKGVAVQLFSTDDLETFSEQLKSQEGTFLIVAHSSSTPDLASLLSGTKQPKLEETDFEKLFKVTIKEGVASIEVLLTTFE